MKKLLFITSLVVLLLNCVAKFETPVPVTKLAGWRSWANYHPPSPKTLDDLPPKIRSNLVTHLKARLGEQFYRRLTLTGGQLIDFQEAYRGSFGIEFAADTNAKNRASATRRDSNYEIIPYELHFEFKMPEIGIASYTAHIRLREDGSVFEEIDLPAFAQNPTKLNFFSLQEALLVASKHDFDPRKFETTIGYDRKKDSLVWCFQQVSEVLQNGAVIKYKGICISAHDGKVLQEYTGIGLVR